MDKIISLLGRHSTAWSTPAAHEQYTVEQVGHWRNKGGIKTSLWYNENENTTYQNCWAIEKAVLKGKFTAMSTSVEKDSDLKWII
jgi:hypothetical protein